MKNAIKTLTLTVEELRRMIESVKTADDASLLSIAVESASQNPHEVDPEKFDHPAARLIAGKFKEKACRLEKLREARQKRRQQKAGNSSVSSDSHPSEPTNNHVEVQTPKRQTVVLTFNDHLVRSLMWIYNNRVALTAAVKRINEVVAESVPDFKIDRSVIDTMISIADQAYGNVILYKNCERSLRPESVEVELGD